MHIKKVDEHENGLAAVGIKPLARGTHHQGAIATQAHRQGVRYPGDVESEGAVIIIEPLVQPVAPVHEGAADESGGFVAVRLQYGSERHHAGGNALAVFLHTIFKGICGGEQ